MSKRDIGAFLFLFASLGMSACVAQCEPLPGSSLAEVVTRITHAEEAALSEYLFGQPETSVKKLSKLIELYDATRCTSVVSAPIQQSYQYQIVLMRARLARQYQKLGNETKAQQETSQALDLGRTLVPGGAWSPAELSNLIDRSDSNIRDKLRPPP